MNIWQFFHVKIMKILIFIACIIQILSILLCHQTEEKLYETPHYDKLLLLYGAGVYSGLVILCVYE